MSNATSTSARQLSSSVQSTLVRLYKGFGIAALLLILLGLLGFLLVNIFYLLDNSWIKPVILTPAHERVIDADAKLAAEKHRQGELQASRSELKLELTALDATIEEYERFEADFAKVSSANGLSIDALLARRELNTTRIEATRAKARKEVLAKRLEAMAKTEGEFATVVAKMKESPYHRASKGRVTVAFVPYDNLDNVDKGDWVYGCKWGLVRCSKVGRVGDAMPGEMSDTHPHSGRSLRGVMVELHVAEEWAAKESALFVGGKPFWLF